MLLFSNVLEYLNGYGLRPFVPEIFKATPTQKGAKLTSGKPSALPGFEAFYQYFNEVFPLSLDQKQDLSRINEFIYYHTILTDTLIDREVEPQPDVVFSLNLVNAHYIALINRLLNKPTEKFWQAYSRFQREFIIACLKEQQEHFKLIKRYTESDFEQISAGKAAHAKIIPCLMATLVPNHNPDYLEKIYRSIDLFFVALQCRDDLRDWRSDLLEQRYSKLLTEICLENNLEEAAFSQQDPVIIGKMVYQYKGLAVFKEAVEYYEQALKSIQDIEGLQTWQKAIQWSIHECQDQSKKLKELILNA